MLTAQEIVEALEGGIAEALPGEKVYKNRLPKDFKRPSCFIEFVKKNITDANAASLTVTAEVQITGFVPTDDYYDSDSQAINLKAEALIAIFAGRCFHAGDRWLDVISADAEYGLDYVMLSAKLSYIDDRLTAKEEADLMEKVIISTLEITGG